MFNSLFKTLLSATCMMSLVVISQYAFAGNLSITTEGNQRCIRSDGLPDHSTGSFPNRGNPHSISKQSIDYCFPLNPVKNNRAQFQRGSIGVALNGVTIRPGTADYYDASSRRGHSRDRSSGWNLEGIGAKDMLGMDSNNAHVDERGLYHYHGIPEALVNSQPSTLIAYAADGFEIHYVGNQQTSSYQLKSGTRPSGPGGKYDGTYNEDWEYIAGSGSLDECNGGLLNGEFVYFATDTYPFYPRCLWGNASSDFGHGGGNNRGQGNHRDSGQQRPQAFNQSQNNQGREGPRRGPPQEALDACINGSVGNQCSFTSPRGQVSGQCVQTPDNQLACKPNHRH